MADKKTDDPTITVTMSMLEALVAAKVAEERRKPIDETWQEQMRRARGQDHPLPAEEIVEVLSPITRARFSVRLIRDSSSRMVVTETHGEYLRPDGWDVSRRDGGLATDAELDTTPEGRPTKKALWELHKRYFLRDWSEIGPTAEGRRELPDLWRAKKKSEAA